jgi:hypothetical protein
MMEKPAKLKSEITVRISIGFQDAPDVHTLLSMTPVRARGKLILHALEQHIKQSGHPAGQVSTQLEIISTWLKERATGINSDALPSSYALPATAIKNPVVTEKMTPVEAPLPQSVLADSATETENSVFNENQSQSLSRWLSG